MKEEKEYKSYWIYILLFLIAYWPLFGHLENLPIVIWDEARHSINAYEMFINGNYLVPHFLGEVDTWNTKPPLMAWSQVFWMEIFGVGELAIRLPSALAGLFTCFYLVWFSKEALGSKKVGFVAALLLLVSTGFVGIQGTRTGDVNAVLCLWLIIANGSFYLLNKTGEKKYVWLWLIATALAVLTKSVAGLLFAPAWLFFLLSEKNFMPLLKSRAFYLAMVVFLLLVGGYYVARENATPGYLHLVYENELGGRMANAKEGHHQPLFYYLNLLWNGQVPLRILFVSLIALMASLTSKSDLRKFFLIAITTHFAILSVSATKLSTYFMPSIPLLLFLGAILLVKLMDRSILRWLFVPMFVYMFGFIYAGQIENTYKPKVSEREHGFYSISYYLREADSKELEKWNGYEIISQYKDWHFKIYLDKANGLGGNIGSKDLRETEVGDSLIVYEYHAMLWLMENFEIEEVYHKENIKFIKVVGKLNMVE